MKHIKQTIKKEYYKFNPGEFLPIYVDGKLSNSKAFHRYRLKWIKNNKQAFWYGLLHQRG